MNPNFIEIIATIFFSFAIVHTFSVSQFEKMTKKYPKTSIRRNFFHTLAEVELIFGLWSFVLIIFYSFRFGIIRHGENHELISGAVYYLTNINYAEPVFVFIIMCMAATTPILETAEKVIHLISKALPINEKMGFFISALICGPLLGSFITEPAAMTVTALVLYNNFFTRGMSDKFKYGTLATLFVNVSIGGTLTNFAAPPVLMVAGKYGWSISHMFCHFGYKASIAVVISTILLAIFFRKELQGEMKSLKNEVDIIKIPIWISVTHLLFIGMVVWLAHYPSVILALFLFFIGFTSITKKYQSELKIKESLLVGFFLAGLVTLGSLQSWWLKELLVKLSDFVLYIGATGLTAITDNAALTYLGSLAPLSESAKYNLVAGSVTGGGLTVIANAPNPAGYGLLKPAFGEKGISALSLFLWGLIPTLIAALCFKMLPSL